MTEEQIKQRVLLVNEAVKESAKLAGFSEKDTAVIKAIGVYKNYV